jgi:hypothetical protein
MPSEVREELQRNLKAQRKPARLLHKQKERAIRSDDYAAGTAAAFLDSVGLTRPTSAVMSVLPGGDSYDEELAQSRELQRRFRQQYPVGDAIPRSVVPSYLWDKGHVLVKGLAEPSQDKSPNTVAGEKRSAPPMRTRKRGGASVEK